MLTYLLLIVYIRIIRAQLIRRFDVGLPNGQMWKQWSGDMNLVLAELYQDLAKINFIVAHDTLVQKSKY
jgi:hypothetical protein